jgi:hypothetical protein
MSRVGAAKVVGGGSPTRCDAARRLLRVSDDQAIVLPTPPHPPIVRRRGGIMTVGGDCQGLGEGDGVGHAAGAGGGRNWWC